MRVKALIWLVVLLVAGGAVYFYFPREIRFEEQGVKYRLGDETRDMEASVRVRIEGKLYRHWFGDRKFRGTIEIEGERLPVPEDQRELTIPLDRNRAGAVIYVYHEDAHPDTYSYGMIYFSRNFESVAFSIHEPNDAQDEGRGGGWNGEDGLMLSAPAGTRAEALRLSNELMRDFWNGAVFR